MQSVIQFDQVFKRFHLERARARSFQELLHTVIKGSRPQSQEDFWALRNVSFGIAPGETVGFIGANGAGKSSILKLIARILEPTSGRVQVNGRVSALLELGAGFHPDLTGRENVFLNGAILGLERADIRRRLDDIIAFAELERFIDVPVRNYSSGMLVRLGFSVATAFRPDILLIDEVLAVGDQAFQGRCLQRITQIQKEGATIVLVSHDLSTTRKLCKRALWLDEGEIKADAITDEAVAIYLEHLWQKNGDGKAVAVGEGRRWGSGEVLIEKVEFLNVLEEPPANFHTGEVFIARMWYTAFEKIIHPSFGVAIYRDDGAHITGPNTAIMHYDIPHIEGSGYVDYVIEHLPLLPGNYEFSATVYDYHSIHPFDHRHRQFYFRVASGKSGQKEGVVAIPCRWNHCVLPNQGVCEN